MSGSQNAAAFADLRSIGGINAATCKVLSQKICDYLHKELAIDKDRIYCNFSDVSASNWGWNGTTFG
jgi:phenylpyruvate tautomerase PptA (4-oxalocrotonate tautomerase family)